jgi:hypothetical protein
VAIGKFPGQRTAFFEAFFEEDYRTHTVPVKKYEPRMFMGEEVPEGATHYIDTGATVLFAKFDESCTMFGVTVRQILIWVENNLTHTTWIPAPSTRYDPTLHTIKELPEQENIMKKEFSKPSDFETGMYLTFGCKREALVVKGYHHDSSKEDVIIYTDGGYDCLQGVFSEGNDYLEYDLGGLASVSWVHPSHAFRTDRDPSFIWKREEKTPEQLAYEALQAQIAEEEARHADSIKALREQAEKFKPKIGG